MAFNFFIMSVRKWLKIHSPRNLAKKPDVGARRALGRSGLAGSCGRCSRPNGGELD